MTHKKLKKRPKGFVESGKGRPVVFQEAESKDGKKRGFAISAHEQPVLAAKQKREREKEDREVRTADTGSDTVNGETIFLGGGEREKTGLAAFREKDTLLGKGAKVLTSPITTVALAGTLAALAAFPAVPVVAVGTRVGSILHTASIHHWSRATGMLVAKKGLTVSSNPILEKGRKIGGTGVDKLFKAGKNRIKMNEKTTALATSEVSKSFSNKAMVLYGSWAGSVFLGKWAQAEAAEPITIPLRDALKQAKETGDYSVYDEYSAAAKEITNQNIWEIILSWSPIAAIPGTINKLAGVKKGIELLDKIAEKDKAAAGQESAFEKQRRESDEASFERRREFQDEMDERFAAR
tara:strand:+ start:5756 stop:6808 length:1053 start_codon:yes stop_codon:yes gene_type:complete